MRIQRDHAVISNGEIYHYGGEMESIHLVSQGQIQIKSFGTGFIAELEADEFFNSFLTPGQMNEVPQEIIA